MDLAEDESAARGEDPRSAPARGRDLVRRSLGQDALGVAAAAPEREVASRTPASDAPGSMPRALVWTGLRISTPTSMRSGMMSAIDPQEWRKRWIRSGADALVR